MSKMERNFQDEEGMKTLVISSEDNKELKMNGNYKLANNTVKKESKLVQKFKGSVLGADIGVKSSGFTNIAILATVIAVATIAIMYLIWRF